MTQVRGDKKNMNNKGLTGVQTAMILIVVIVLVAGLVAFSLSNSPATAQANKDITVYIDAEKQTGNYTAPQTLSWTGQTAPNTYTKEFNVTNTGTQPYTLILITQSPALTTFTWAYNNSLLEPMSYASSALTLTLLTDASTSGPYVWRLIATNSTVTPTATPIPSNQPSPTPVPNSLQFTIAANMGVSSINVTANSNNLFTLLYNDLPATYTLTPGDTLKFQADISEGYTFNGWQFADGSMPNDNNPILLTNIQGNFTVTAKTLITP